jgi:hypothetical protein
MSLILDGSNGLTFPNSTVQASAGQILQVVNATYTTQTSTSSSTFSDTGLTATITPKFATSKILVLVNLNGVTKTTADNGVGFFLVRDSTNISRISDFAATTGTTTTNSVGSVSTGYLDSPATTSATTYKIQFNATANTASVLINYAGSSVMSTITLLEIAG